MVSFREIAEKWVLVIDDMEGMRSQLRMSLSSSGFAKLHIVPSIREALIRLNENHYDLILCDYSLGDSTNGQQFLEYLRTNDLIKRNTLFVMATAEQAYGKVVAASECAPDDYLLKPFTAEQLNIRLLKLLEKQAYFVAIDQATDKKNWPLVIAECDKLLEAKDKHFVELCKIKGSALIRNKQLAEAEALYRKVLSIRPIAWAKLGLARVLAMLGQAEDSERLAREVLAETPTFMAAYDFLSKLVADSGNANAALEVLQKAREIAPGTMSRLRELSALALTAGKPEVAEKVMRETLQAHKYSPVRQVNDYVILSNSLIVQNKNKEAISVVQDAKKSFSDNKSKVVLGATESTAYHADGDDKHAESSLQQALAASGDLGGLPADVVMALADACIALDKGDDAIKLLRHVVQNSGEDDAVKALVHNKLLAAGKTDAEAHEFIVDSEQEVINLNNDGVLKAREGKLNEAIALLSEAANRLPDNLQILGNAALVLALDLITNGKDASKLSKCLQYRDQLMKKSPNYPKLEQIDKVLRKLK